jgi:hypothetical protein
MPDQPDLRALTSAQLLERAEEYAAQAEAATFDCARSVLNQIARSYVEMATEQALEVKTATRH